MSLNRAADNRLPSAHGGTDEACVMCPRSGAVLFDVLSNGAVNDGHECQEQAPDQ